MPSTLAALRRACAGPVLTPGESGFSERCRLAWAPQVPVEPAVIVDAVSPADVAAGVSFARASGASLTVMATGHGTLVPCQGGVLIRLDRLNSVAIDPSARTARLGGGVTWAPVMVAAQAVGLAPLVGSALAVGAAGYSLGGGVGWLARAHGWAADQIAAATVVLADGNIVTTSATERPELLWALRGGGGNFGVVTELVTGLVPVTEVFAGSVTYPIAMARSVLTAFAAWVTHLPPSVTASVTFMRYPDLPTVPGPLQGKATIVVRACATGDLSTGAALIEPMRVIGQPLLDTFRVMPFGEVATISSEPAASVPVRDRTLLLNELDAGAIDALLAAVGPGKTDALMMVDIRSIAGAASLAAPGTGCAIRHPAPFLLLATSPAAGDTERRDVDAKLAALAAGLAPVTASGLVPTFVGASDPRRHDVAAAYRPADLARLRRIKALYDPENLFRPALNILPAPA